MKPVARLSVLVGLLIAVCAVAPRRAVARTWTNDQGQTLEAEFVRLRVSDRTVLLRDAEGKLVPAPITRLSEEDQQWIETYKDFASPRVWGDPDKRIRGRFQVLRDDHVEVRMASERIEVPLAELTAEDVAHLEAMYAHVDKELPAKFESIKAAAVANAPPEDAVERDWTDARGRSITALYGGTTGDKAILWIKGKRFEYPLSRLSDADRSWVGRQNLDRLASDLRGGWSAAASIAAAAMGKAMTGGDAPPMAMLGGGPPMPGDSSFTGREQPPYDEFSDPPRNEFGEVEPAYGGRQPAPAPGPAAEYAYQAPEPPVDPAMQVDAPVEEPAADTPVEPAASVDGRGPPPWINDINDLSYNEIDSRLREAFGEWVDNDEDIGGDAYCHHCEGEFMFPTSYTAGSPCPFCGTTLEADDLSFWDDDGSGGGAVYTGTPWYFRRWFRRLVIGLIVTGIGVAVKLSQGGDE